DERDVVLLLTHYGSQTRNATTALARIPLKAHSVVHFDTSTLGRNRHVDASLEGGRYLGHVVLSEKSPGEGLSGITTVTSVNLHWDLPFVFQQEKLTYRSGETIPLRLRVPGTSRGSLTVKRLWRVEPEPEMPTLLPVKVECDTLAVTVTEKAFGI